MPKKRINVKYENSYALLIGIEDYEEWDNYDNLWTSVPSILETNEILKKFNFNENRILIAPNKERGLNDIPAGRIPTRENILDELEIIHRNATINDRVLIYFSGHGDIHNNHHVLVPFKSDFIETYQEFLSIAEQIKAKHIFFIIDACHSGECIRECIPKKKHAIGIGDDRNRLDKKEIRILTSAGTGTASDKISGSDLSPFGASVINSLYYASIKDSAFSAYDLCIKVVRDADDWLFDQLPVNESLFNEIYGRFLFQNGYWDVIPSYYQKNLDKALTSKKVTDCEPLINIFSLYTEDIHSQASIDCFKHLMEFQALREDIAELVQKRLVRVYKNHFSNQTFYYYDWIKRIQEYSEVLLQKYCDNLEYLLNHDQFKTAECNFIKSKIKGIIDDEIYPNLLDEVAKEKFQVILYSMQKDRSIKLAVDKPGKPAKKPLLSFDFDSAKSGMEDITGIWKGFNDRIPDPGDKRFSGAFDLFIEQFSRNKISGKIHEPIYFDMIRELKLTEELLEHDYLEFEVEGSFNPETCEIIFTEFCLKQLVGDDIDWRTVFEGNVDLDRGIIHGNYFIEKPVGCEKVFTRTGRHGIFQLTKQ